MRSSRYGLGERTACSAPEADGHLISGFSFHEPWGRWTDGPYARIEIEHGREIGLLRVELWAARAFCADGEPCDLVVSAGWEEPRLFSLPSEGGRIAFATSAAETPRPGLLELEVRIVRPKRPEEPPADPRALGMGLEAYRLTPLA